MSSVESISNVFVSLIKNLTQSIESRVSKTLQINGHSLVSDITLRSHDISGLEHVDNTSDMDKPVSIAQQALFNMYVPLTNTINGHSFSENSIQILHNEIPGLENVNNTLDIMKPVSIPQQTALNLKVDKTTTINTHALSSNITLTKYDIGLSNVDNTTDVDKPISVAQQSQFDSLLSMINSLNQTIGSLSNTSSSNVPVGVVMLYFSNTPPLNYLICDGSSLLISDYQDLYAILGQTYNNQSNTNSSLYFNLPDLRGEFIRGLDRGRNVDVNRTLSVQWQSSSTALPSTTPFQTNSQGSHSHTTDAQGAHTHSYTQTSINGTLGHGLGDGGPGGSYYPNILTTGTSTTDSQGLHVHTTDVQGAHTHTITSGGDNETRPRNMAANYIIKVRI